MNVALLMFAILWTVSFMMCVIFKSWWYLLIPYIFWIVNEILSISLGLDIIPADDRTSVFYDLASWYTRYANIDSNYSEGYYINDNYDISSEQAQEQKFDKILELLGAKKGQEILNLGCGTCSFEKYCKSKGINMVAVSISNEQVKVCKADGIEAYNLDYRKFYPKFAGRFDHIVMMGSSEHLNSGPALKDSTYIRKNKMMQDLFRMLHKYLKKDGKIFYSALHINKKYVKSFGNYILERAYGGTFSLNTPEMITSTAPRFNITYMRDSTKDYYMATVKDDKHFGNPNRPFSLASIFLLSFGFVYPPAWHMLIYGLFGYWMWMFDGKTHYDWNKRYSLAPEDKRPVTLWWIVFQAEN
jgi:cyclopropane fatty-acyl-phospholipid synthase-like methyltransferase